MSTLLLILLVGSDGGRVALFIMYYFSSFNDIFDYIHISRTIIHNNKTKREANILHEEINTKINITILIM